MADRRPYNCEVVYASSSCLFEVKHVCWCRLDGNVSIRQLQDIQQIFPTAKNVLTSREQRKRSYVVAHHIKLTHEW
jgi:hypothetical protein